MIAKENGVGGAAKQTDYPYPPSPAGSSASQSHNSMRYRIAVLRAVCAVLIFVMLYLALIAAFLGLSWRAFSGLEGGGILELLGHFIALFCALYLIKNLFFVDALGVEHSRLEAISPEQQPLLFNFLRRLANEMGVSIPQRVYLSPDVGVGCFSQVSVLNLIWPTRKNLVIGLGLVNSLNLAEFKAVCAHELARASRRDNWLGQWAEMSAAILGRVCSRRDVLDRGIAKWSQAEIQLAWVAYVLKALCWMLRSMMDLAYQLSLFVSPFLLRELALRADRMAVSVAGSDALVNAIYRLIAADQVWAQTLQYARCAQHGVPDVYRLQDEMLVYWRLLRNDPGFGIPPTPIPERKTDANTKSIFPGEQATPPEMWQDYPSNLEREAQARRCHVNAACMAELAWVVFTNAPSTRERLSFSLLPKLAQPCSDEKLRAGMLAYFGHDAFQPEYRGCYFGRSPVAGVLRAQMLFDMGAGTEIALEKLYPVKIGQTLTQLALLKRERSRLDSSDYMVFRGKAYLSVQIPRLIADIDAQIAALGQKLAKHDRMCRSMHLMIARSLGQGWEARLLGLAALLHYADSRECRLGYWHDICHREIVPGASLRLAQKSVVRKAQQATQCLYTELDSIFSERGSVVLDATLAKRLGIESWQNGLSEFRLSKPGVSGLEQWLEDAEPYFKQLAAALAQLKGAALSELLQAEAQLGAAWRQGGAISPAPLGAAAPDSYQALAISPLSSHGNGMAARFLNAHPFMPVYLRGAGVTAVLLVLSVFWFGRVSVTVLNGLGDTVRVRINSQSISIPPNKTAKVDIMPFGSVSVRATTQSGMEIEAFEVDLAGDLTSRFYNIAGAEPLLEWTAAYGSLKNDEPPQELGTPRWGATKAMYVFTTPPDRLPSKQWMVAGLRKVLTASGLGADPDAQLSFYMNDA